MENDRRYFSFELVIKIDNILNRVQIKIIYQTIYAIRYDAQLL